MPSRKDRQSAGIVLTCFALAVLLAVLAAIVDMLGWSGWMNGKGH